jgi:alkanesulfonate monooxygenase SsuD/methylene tetrahydromethanopterin reductase-like flavin-dependent oxidoreductase (luciferase family)
VTDRAVGILFSKEITLKFGVLGMTSAELGSDHGSVMQRWVDFAVEADRLGYWSVWTTEHHFASNHDYKPFGVGPEVYAPEADYDLAADPFVLLSYAAAKTKRVRLGTAVAITHWDHPLRLAERAMMLDALSGGRVELGIGKGAGFREVEVFGVPTDPDASNRKFAEAVDIIERAWSTERFSYDGEFYKVPELAVLPHPAQRVCPIYIGSASDASAAMAAERGLSYATITWPLTGMDRYKSKLSTYHEAAARAGKDVSQNGLPTVLYAYCGESDDEARETVYHHMNQFQYINEQHYEFGLQADDYKRLFGADKDTMEHVHDLSMYPIEHQIVGSVDTVRERIAMYQQELDLNYLVMNVGFGLMPHDKMVASMRRLAEEVIPQFTDNEDRAATDASLSTS